MLRYPYFVNYILKIIDVAVTADSFQVRFDPANL